MSTLHTTLQMTRRQDRVTAYQTLRQLVLKDPGCVPAWLELSKVVDDSSRQRECLEYALRLDPTNSMALERMKMLQVTELIASMPAFTAPTQRETRQRLGEHLLSMDIITPDQLTAALSEQRQRRRNGLRTPLGEVFIALTYVTPEQVARALIVQQQQTPLRVEGFQRIGEYLVADGYVTHTQLEIALTEQLNLSRQGRQVRLGDLLLQKSWISPGDLDLILERQRNAFAYSFET